MLPFCAIILIWFFVDIAKYFAGKLELSMIDYIGLFSGLLADKALVVMCNSSQGVDTMTAVKTNCLVVFTMMGWGLCMKLLSELFTFEVDPVLDYLNLAQLKSAKTLAQNTYRV